MFFGGYLLKFFGGGNLFLFACGKWEYSFATEALKDCYAMNTNAEGFLAKTQGRKGIAAQWEYRVCH